MYAYMKVAHNVTLSVFAKEEEDKEQIKSCLLELIPFDIAEEKVKLDEDTAIGFNQRKINIFEIRLEKERHVKRFLENLLSKLNQEQKEMLLKRLDVRVDDECNFFIRLDKDKLLNKEYWITDSGNCFHIKISIAAYPAKRENAIQVVKQLMGS